MSGHFHPFPADQHRPLDDLSMRDARHLVNHYFEWMPFGGAGADEIFVMFGVSRGRYHSLVSAAVDLVGSELSLERRSRIRSSLSSGRQRVA